MRSVTPCRTSDRDPAMAIRQPVVPVAQIGSSVAPWLIIIGVVHELTSAWRWSGSSSSPAAVAFTFITLPVEFGASNRALAFVEPLGLIGERGDGAEGCP